MQVALVLCLLFSIAALVLVRRARLLRELDRERVEEIRRAENQDRRERDDPRVTHKRCVLCEQRIVFEHDGARCDSCNSPIHVTCAKAHRGSHPDLVGHDIPGASERLLGRVREEVRNA
jgi:hypothetical protein